MELSEPSIVPQPASVVQDGIVLTPIERIWLVPLKSREEACGKVAKHAIGLGACARCVFRLLKVKDVKFYREDRDVRTRALASDEELRNAIKTALANKSSDSRLLSAWHSSWSNNTKASKLQRTPQRPSPRKRSSL